MTEINPGLAPLAPIFIGVFNQKIGARGARPQFCQFCHGLQWLAR